MYQGHEFLTKLLQCCCCFPLPSHSHSWPPPLPCPVCFGVSVFRFTFRAHVPSSPLLPHPSLAATCPSPSLPPPFPSLPLPSLSLPPFSSFVHLGASLAFGSTGLAAGYRWRSSSLRCWACMGACSPLATHASYLFSSVKYRSPRPPAFAFMFTCSSSRSRHDCLLAFASRLPPHICITTTSSCLRPHPHVPRICVHVHAFLASTSTFMHSSCSCPRSHIPRVCIRVHAFLAFMSDFTHFSCSHLRSHSWFHVHDCPLTCLFRYVVYN